MTTKKNLQHNNSLRTFVLGIMALTACFFLGNEAMAQSYQKMYAPKHKGGDFYMGAGIGFSQSLAENAVKSDFIMHQIPSADVLIGYNFNPYFGLRLTGGLNCQTSRCSNAAHKAMPDVYGNGRYNFYCLTGTLSGIVNVTNMFFGYDSERPVSWALMFGGGYLSTFGFSKKINGWNEYPYYPVDGKNKGYGTGYAGIQCNVRLSRPSELAIEVRTNATDNKYNGVWNQNHLDFYLDLMVNYVYHFRNGQKLYKFEVPKKVAYVDPVLRDNSDEYTETLRYGESMQTTIPFYAGFYYLNDVSTKRAGIVAKFLKENPQVSLKVVGHPDVIDDQDVEYNKMLAQKRAEAVIDILVEKYRVSRHRLQATYDDTVLQPFKTVRDWVPAVNFIMVSGAAEEE